MREDLQDLLNEKTVNKCLWSEPDRGVSVLVGAHAVYRGPILTQGEGNTLLAWAPPVQIGVAL